MTKAEFIEQHFPPDVVRNLKKVGFFKKGKLTHDDIEARVCQFFGYESIFDYGKDLEGLEGYHLSLTEKGRKEALKKP